MLVSPLPQADVALSIHWMLIGVEPLREKDIYVHERAYGVWK